MTVVSAKMRWGVERRLEFIEFRVFWEGGVNRSDLTDQFGISVPQASADLSAYQKIAPGNLTYNASEKRYVRATEFEPRIIVPNADRYLSQLRFIADGIMGVDDSWIHKPPSIDAMPILNRSVKPLILQRILEAIQAQGSLEIRYQSMNPKNPDLMWRWITPHAFGSDGTRWHVRAFCHTDRRFKDFLLSRCQDTRGDGPAGADAYSDIDWVEKFEVILEPNPALSRSQQDAVETDYSMADGKLRLSIRRALLFYLNKHLRLDFIKYDPRPALNPIVVANRNEFDEAVQFASF